MANICSFQMKVTGEPDSIREFIDILNFEHKNGRHMYRVSDIYVDDEEEIEHGSAIINGSCAWSVHTCMMEGAHSYGKNELENYNAKCREIINRYEGKNDLVSRHNLIHELRELEENVKGTTLLRESRLLNLTIEVYSEEPGVGFEEHYVIQNGRLIISEERSMHEYYTGDFETREEFNEEYGLNISEEEYVEDGYIKIGGFDEWEFDEWKDELEGCDL